MLGWKCLGKFVVWRRDSKIRCLMILVGHDEAKRFAFQEENWHSQDSCSQIRVHEAAKLELDGMTMLWSARPHELLEMQVAEYPWAEYFYCSSGGTVIIG